MCPGDGRNRLQGGKRGDQADGHVESHRPALFAHMVRMQVIVLFQRAREGDIRVALRKDAPAAPSGDAGAAAAAAEEEER